MNRNTTLVRLAQNGRLGIPVRQRRQVGLQDGGLVVVEALEGELRVRPVEAVIDDLQQWAGCYNDAPTRSAVDMLIEQRRREAASEEA